MSKKNKGLRDGILDEVVKTVVARKKVEKIVLFGSRATGTFKEASDVDLAIFSEDLTDRDINLMKADLEEGIKTPLKFDLVHFNTLEKEALKEEILSEGITIYEP